VPALLLLLHLLEHLCELPLVLELLHLLHGTLHLLADLGKLVFLPHALVEFNLRVSLLLSDELALALAFVLLPEALVDGHNVVLLTISLFAEAISLALLEVALVGDFPFEVFEAAKAVKLAMLDHSSEDIVL